MLTQEDRDGQRLRRERFADMTDAAAALIRRTIAEAEPDPKMLRHITGALKDLRELLDGQSGEAGQQDEIVIRIEADPAQQAQEEAAEP